MGRESYNYTPTEGRNTTCWLNIAQDFACGAGSSFWGGFYVVNRDVFNFLNTVDAATALTSVQKEGARGFAETFEALSLEFIALRGVNGGPITINAVPTTVSPFVSRDSLFNYVVGRLDNAATHLSAAVAGGDAFVFSLTNNGFAGFDKPSTFLLFNRGLAARVNIERQTFGNAACPGVTCYTAALADLTQAAAFVNNSNLATGPRNGVLARRG